MVEEKKAQDEERGFVVRDKRFSARKEDEIKVEEERKIEEPKKEAFSEKEVPLHEINFINFIFSLSTSALIQLGEVEDPVTRKQVKNLPLAKQTIDIIGMLKEKTKGNLTQEEERFLDNILYDLRIRYVKAVS